MQTMDGFCSSNYKGVVIPSPPPPPPTNHLLNVFHSDSLCMWSTLCCAGFLHEKRSFQTNMTRAAPFKAYFTGKTSFLVGPCVILLIMTQNESLMGLIHWDFWPPETNTTIWRDSSSNCWSLLKDSVHTSQNDHLSSCSEKVSTQALPWAQLKTVSCICQVFRWHCHLNISKCGIKHREYIWASSLFEKHMWPH